MHLTGRQAIILPCPAASFLLPSSILHASAADATPLQGRCIWPQSARGPILHRIPPVVAAHLTPSSNHAASHPAPCLQLSARETVFGSGR
jgi:hypothetical protein